ncbi:hypothetical protein CBS101457_006936 [Exobasidium rhododendri]|nr:hypothetical protein CBS101457_006936 [Exobasidium rhododendri]
MRFAHALVALLPLLGSALVAARGAPKPLTHVTCAEYDAFVTQNVEWEKNGSLEHIDPGPKEAGLYKMGHKTIKRDQNRKGRRYDLFKYTFFVGVGKAAGDVLYVQADRKYGEGLGQQFLVNFRDVNDSSKILKQYWIKPNERCTIKSPFAAAAVGKITVWSRI